MSLEAASEAHADELQKLLEKAAKEIQSVQEKHRERLGKFEADCALQLELREEEQVSKHILLSASLCRYHYNKCVELNCRKRYCSLWRNSTRQEWHSRRRKRRVLRRTGCVLFR